MTKRLVELVCFSHRCRHLLIMKANKEILLHTSTQLLETATSNIAIQTETGEWITPRLDRTKTPFLDGVMRRYLLDQGSIKEGELGIEGYEKAQREGRRVIGFNGLR
jgi:branched-subunit amino acid aminotransferase/4-amino-4-deoxychorismate lyase